MCMCLDIFFSPVFFICFNFFSSPESKICVAFLLFHLNSIAVCGRALFFPFFQQICSKQYIVKCFFFLRLNDFTSFFSLLVNSFRRFFFKFSVYFQSVVHIYIFSFNRMRLNIWHCRH